eukprot:gene7570-8410_t
MVYPEKLCSGTIIDAITNLGLSLNNCRGQGYDGAAGNMAGKCSVTISRCLQITRPFTKQLQARDMDALKFTEKLRIDVEALLRLLEALEEGKEVGVDQQKKDVVQ